MKTKQYIAPKIHRNDFLLYNQSNGLRNKERRKGKKNFIRLLSSTLYGKKRSDERKLRLKKNEKGEIYTELKIKLIKIL